MAHRALANRAIHWVMIPIECWSFFVILASIVPNAMLWGAGILLGGLSVLLARRRFGLGIGCFLFHIAAVYHCLWVTQPLEPRTSFLVALTAWTVAWFFQVCIGHWVIERNQPNVANLESVSLLAMCQSVLLAWST